MENQFTNCEAYDNLFPKYRNWEEVPMSTLNFNSKTSQVCFVSLPKDKALEIITSKAIPVNTIAYEYSDEVPKKNGDVIVAVEIDTTHMLDLTHKPDYIKYMQSKLDKNIKLDKSISIIRKISMDESINQFRVIYIIRNNSKVKDVQKAKTN